MGISFLRRPRFAPHSGATGLAVGLTVCALAAAGCGSSSSSSASSAASQSTASSASSTAAATTSSDIPAPAVNELPAAERPALGQFPRAGGRSLEQLGKLVKSSVSMGAATGTFTPGVRRFAFALTTDAGRYVYAPTAIYIAATPTSPAQGPFPAPADPMGVLPQYRSKQNMGPGGIAAIYASRLPVPPARTFALLVITRGPSGLIGATRELRWPPPRPSPTSASARPTSPPTPSPPSTATSRC